MKISQNDRFQAIARNPHFRNLLNGFIEAGKLGKDIESMTNYSNMLKIFDLHGDELSIVRKISLKKLDTDEEFCSISRPTVIPTSVKDLALKYIWGIQAETFTVEKILRAKQKILDGRFLLAEIDLLAKETDIIKELKAVLKKMQNTLKIKKGSARNMSVDPWLVYDMYQKEKDLLNTAKLDFKLTPSPFIPF